MSRLFTRLENIGQEGSDKEPLPLPEAQGRAEPPSTLLRSDAANPATPLPAVEVEAAPMPPLVPGYVGAPVLSARPLPPATRPTWTVKLWLASLVSLIALSLFVLFVPQQSTSPRERPAAAVQDRPNAAATTAEAATRAIAPSLPAAITPAARPVPRTDAAPAPVRPATPVQARPPTSSAVPCSEAMLALNLCATPSP